MVAVTWKRFWQKLSLCVFFFVCVTARKSGVDKSYGITYRIDLGKDILGSGASGREIDGKVFVFYFDFILLCYCSCDFH